jgi:hypothetical protein
VMKVVTGDGGVRQGNGGEAGDWWLLLELLKLLEAPVVAF